jgi:hypothetical protein
MEKQIGQEDELRFREHDVKLANQSIVELAYLTKDMIELVYAQKLTSERANCYIACFYLCQSFLEIVDEEYLRKRHTRLKKFYRNDRELFKFDNTLAFEENGKRGELD